MRLFTKILDPIKEIDKYKRYTNIYPVIAKELADTVRADFSSVGRTILDEIVVTSDLCSKASIEFAVNFYERVIDFGVLTDKENYELETLIDNLVVYDMLFHTDGSEFAITAALMAVQIDTIFDEFDPYEYSGEYENARSRISEIKERIYRREIDSIIDNLTDIVAENDEYHSTRASTVLKDLRYFLALEGDQDEDEYIQEFYGD